MIQEVEKKAIAGSIRNLIDKGVAIDDLNGRAGISMLADNKQRKFVVAEVMQSDGSKSRMIMISEQAGNDVGHKDIVANFTVMLAEINARCKPLYGGRIVVSNVTKTIIAGGNSITYPDKMNPKEVAGLLERGMEGTYDGYRILCKDGIDDIKSLLESSVGKNS
jgi:hypothetical protein